MPWTWITSIRHPLEKSAQSLLERDCDVTLCDSKHWWCCIRKRRMAILLHIIDIQYHSFSLSRVISKDQFLFFSRHSSYSGLYLTSNPWLGWKSGQVAGSDSSQAVREVIQGVLRQGVNWAKSTHRLIASSDNLTVMQLYFPIKTTPHFNFK